jgi:hypothetical protein
MTAKAGLMDGPPDPGHRRGLVFDLLPPRQQERGTGELQAVRVMSGVGRNLGQKAGMVLIKPAVHDHQNLPARSLPAPGHDLRQERILRRQDPLGEVHAVAKADLDLLVEGGKRGHGNLVEPRIIPGFFLSREEEQQWPLN